LVHRPDCLSLKCEQIVKRVLFGSNAVSSLAANFGLAIILFNANPLQWYISVLCIVWPMQAAIAWRVITDKGKAGEIGKE
jgi:hypothetical protein